MNEAEEVAETFTKAVPKHFLFKIQAFSLLSNNSIEKYESNEFEAGGYKWNLLLYPNGNKSESGGDGHISLYLALEDTASLPACWELNVFFRLFLFDQIQEKYLIREDVERKMSRFHEMKKVWGFPQFVSLAKFKDPSNGYLVDDTCVFGAEVFVSVTHTWRIDDFSKIKEETLYSEKFKAGDFYWKILIYPNGFDKAKNNSVSILLNFVDDLENNPGLKVYADYKFCVKDQRNGKHIEYSSTDKDCFEVPTKDCWGWPKFISLSEMNDNEKGYLMNDTCIVEAEVQVLEVATS